MSVQQFLAILAARWLSAVIVIAIAVLGALGLSMALPKKYTASASVMLDVSAPDPIGGGNISGLMTAQYMATQVDVVNSERVARRAAQLLNLMDDPARKARWAESTGGNGDYGTWLAESLQRSLDVQPSRESQVINITYASSDPAFAAAAANAFMQSYLDVSLELRVDPARVTNAFFSERVKQLRDELERSQSKLSGFMKDRGLIGASDGRLDIESARLSELSTQMLTLQALAAESSGRESQGRARPDELPEVLTNSTVNALSADVTREESRLQELTSRLGDAHPQVVEQRAKLAELRQRLETAIARASGSVRVANSVTQSRLAQTRAALEAQRAKVLELKSMRDEAAVLQRDVESAQRAYDTALGRLNQTGLESKTNQTNISILKRASEPAFPSSPNVFLNVAAALALGTGLALALVLVRELLDRRLRTLDDVYTGLKQPVLISLPVARHAAKGVDNSRVKAIKSRVFTGLPRPKAQS